MSSGVGCKQVAGWIMHDGKRRNLSLSEVLTYSTVEKVKAIIRAKYGTYRPRLSAIERFEAGQEWNNRIRKWVTSPVKV